MLTKARLVNLLIILAIAAIAIACWWLTIRGGAGSIIPSIALSASIAFVILAYAFIADFWRSMIEGAIRPLGVRMLDDRGRAAWVADHDRLATPVEFDAKAKKAYAEWAAHHPLPWGRLFLPIILVLAAVWLLQWSFRHMVPGAPWFVRLALFIGCSPALVLVIRPAIIRRDARFLVSIARCPSCGYELAAMRAESDGCVVCPECGAAWRVPAGTE